MVSETASRSQDKGTFMQLLSPGAAHCVKQQAAVTTQESGKSSVTGDEQNLFCEGIGTSSIACFISRYDQQPVETSTNGK